MNIKLNAVLNATRATEFAALPFLMGDMTLDQWVKSIAGQTVTTKNGHVVSKLAQATWHSNAQRALNGVSLAMKIAVDTGLMPWTKASGIANQAHKRMELLLAALAGVRGQRDEMLFPLADIQIKTKEGSFDAFAKGGDAPYTEEELLEMGWGWEQIEEFLDLQANTRTSMAENTGEGSVSGGEGWYRTTLHTVGQLGDIPLNQIQFGEWIAAKALVSTVAWPEGPMWDAFLGRVVLSWEGRCEFIKDDKKLTPSEKVAKLEEEAEKQAKRDLDIEDINAKPMHVRWTVNHLARRAWRDIQVLQQDLARHQSRVDELVQLDYLEERYGPESEEFKAQWGRVNLGEAAEQTRKAYFHGYAELGEADVGLAQVASAHVRNIKDDQGELSIVTRSGPSVRYTEDGVEFAGTREIHDVTYEGEKGRMTRMSNFSDLGHTTPYQKELAWAQACVEAASNALDIARAMHKHLRHMDTELAKLWEIALEEQDNELNMPTQPPVYWNADGWYLTEAEALAALAKEQAESKERRALSQEEALMEAIAGISAMDLMN